MLRALVRRLRRKFRKARFLEIERRFGPSFGQGWVLDLGGGHGSFYTGLLPDRRRTVLLDINRQEVARAAREARDLRAVVADGEQLPFASASIGLIVSNSVIEHVAHPYRMAAEIRRVGRQYFVQTPNAGFPVETHSYVGIPFYRQIRRPQVRRFLCKLFGANYEYLESVRYLEEETLRRLFPEGRIDRELALGLTKSFYVIGTKVGG